MADRKVQKEIRYLNKDFGTFRADLIEFAKIYFPQTYNDFNESSPGMMFIEMASYVGDVLSYYIDNQFKEGLLAYAEEKRVVFETVQSLGYKPKLSSPASTNLEVFQVVPSIGNADTVKADMRYALNITSLEARSTTDGTTFRTREDCNFKFSSSYSPITTEVYEVDAVTKLPAKYLLKKRVQITSGDKATEYFVIGVAEKYRKLVLSNDNIIEILSIVDSDGNNWYEVPFLAQDTLFQDVENSSESDPELAQYSNDAPYILKLVKTPRRYTTFIREDNKTELRFGAGVSDSPDEEIVPNPDSVGSNLPGSPSFLDTAFDPSNFLSTKAYGLSPSSTTLTVTYTHGGGIDDNTAQGEIKNISAITYDIDDTNLSAVLVQDAKDSVRINNIEPAVGGKSAETVVEVKNNAMAYFQAQQRAVTKPDYIVRAYALPAKYGNLAKVYIVQDDQLSQGSDAIANPDALITEGDVGQTIKSLMGRIPTRIPNPMALNMYTLGFNNKKKLVSLNQAVKENLKTYLSQYRMVTDAVNIKNAWIINIGVKFSIMTKRNTNKNEVTLRCIEAVKDFFNIDTWQINQPIIVSDIAYKLSLVDGVASVIPPVKDDGTLGLPVEVFCRWNTDEGYSGNIYDIKSATKNGVIYPSVDPSIFELKFPNVDIQGVVVGSL
jgi:hypothetical protein